MKEYVMHYASPYYDPVKAHEYYMKHRNLKGKRSGTLNDAGKEAAFYVKGQISDKTKSIQENIKSIAKADSLDRQKASTQIGLKIKHLRQENAEERKRLEMLKYKLKLNQKSGEENTDEKNELKKNISNTLSENKKKVESVQNEIKDLQKQTNLSSIERARKIEKLRTQITDLKETYEKELDKIYEESGFKTVKKSGKSKSTSGQKTKYWNKW